MPDDRAGPYLTAALICERVLEEKDGAKSLIRVFDTLYLPKQDSIDIQTVHRRFWIYLRFVSGGFTGTTSLKIVIDSSQGEGVLVSEPEVELDIEFPENPTISAEILIETRLQIREPGLLWFDVYLGGNWQTRMPYDVQFMPQSGEESMTPVGC